MPTAPTRQTIGSRLRASWPRLRRWLLRGTLVALLAPLLISLSFNFYQPPTTAVMLRRAVLAAEDDRFYLHWGLDVVEIQKAIDRAERGGRLRGASTITQQVAKNIFLWEGRSFLRKGLEAYLTLVLELTLPKERILDLYLNLAEWGDGVFGAEMAARRHFGVSAARLTPEQSARLAAILPSPRRWSPQGGVATRRATMILERMQYAAPR